MIKVRGLLPALKNNYVRAKAELKGEALSHARRILPAQDIPSVANKLAGTNGHHQPGAPQAIRTTGVRMLDGKPMVFFTDGSLRHALGRKTTKAARKALKRARHQS